MAFSARFEKASFGFYTSFSCTLFSFLVFFLSKIYMKNGEGFELQILQHLAIFFLLASLFSLSRTTFNTWLRKPKVLAHTIDFVANHSLEIYLVHLPFVFLMRHMNMTNTFYIIPLLVVSLVLSACLKKIVYTFSIKFGF
jgi:hypothetical protein